jgi:hypothetical protein
METTKQLKWILKAFTGEIPLPITMYLETKTTSTRKAWWLTLSMSYKLWVMSYEKSMVTNFIDELWVMSYELWEKHGD